MAAPTRNWPQWPPRFTVTELAKIYGHPPPYRDRLNTKLTHTEIKYIKPLRSGYTPLDKLSFGGQRKRYERLDGYQVDRFDFSIADIQAMDAYTMAYTTIDRYDGSSDFIYLHDLVQKPHWEQPLPCHLASFPIRDDKGGYWETRNERVWDVLYPVLKLVSQFLTKREALPFIETLLYATPEFIDPFTVWNDVGATTVNQTKAIKLSAFRPDPSTLGEIIDMTRSTLQETSKGIQLHINSCAFHEDSNLENSTFEMSKTVTSGRNPSQNVRVFLAYELLEPLLNPAITKPERATCTWLAAASLLHELIHAIWFIVRGPRLGIPDISQSEPWYENEVQAGLGFAMENAVFGGVGRGHTTKDNNPAKGAPSAGIVAASWDNAWTSPYSNQRFHMPLPPNYNIQEIYPIPISYTSRMRSAAYWDLFVLKHGPPALEMGPKYRGVSKMKGKSGPMKNDTRTMGGPPVAGQDIVIDGSMSLLHNELARMENQRRKQVAEIKKAINRLAQIQVPKKKKPVPKDPDEDIGFPDMSQDPPVCPRYDEIKYYLFGHMRELALDTLNGETTEHMLYAYIVREGELAITVSEWREFLRLCHFNRELFRYRPKGAGPSQTEFIVSRIDNGTWPANPPDSTSQNPIRHPPLDIPRPENVLFDNFLTGMDTIVSKYLRSPPAQFDFDKALCTDLLHREWETMYDGMRSVLKDARGTVYPNDYLTMSLREMDMCIAESVNRGLQWQWGPRGVLRRKFPYIELVGSPIGGLVSDDENGPGDDDDDDTEEEEEEKEEFSDVEDDEGQGSGQQGQTDEGTNVGNDGGEGSGQQTEDGTAIGGTEVLGPSVLTAAATAVGNVVSAVEEAAARIRKVRQAWLDKIDSKTSVATTQPDTATNPTTNVADTTKSGANTTITGANTTTTANTNVVKPNVDADMTGVGSNMRPLPANQLQQNAPISSTQQGSNLTQNAPTQVNPVVTTVTTTNANTDVDVEMIDQ